MALLRATWIRDGRAWPTPAEASAEPDDVVGPCAEATVVPANTHSHVIVDSLATLASFPVRPPGRHPAAALIASPTPGAPGTRSCSRSVHASAARDQSFASTQANSRKRRRHTPGGAQGQGQV